MNKDKQIEEMAKIIDDDACKSVPVDVCDAEDDCAHCRAKHLYNAGYRKQSKNTVVLPYKVGTVVYVLKSKTSNGKNLYLREERISHYRIFSERSFMCFESERLSVPDYLWETTVFISQEEAEAKMKGGE